MFTDNYRNRYESRRTPKGRLMVQHTFIKRPFIEDDERPTRPMPHNPYDLGEL